jgi:hypothetical protein
MLPEVVEVDGVPAVKIHLFKQEVITGAGYMFQVLTCERET